GVAAGAAPGAGHRPPLLGQAPGYMGAEARTSAEDDGPSRGHTPTPLGRASRAAADGGRVGVRGEVRDRSKASVPAAGAIASHGVPSRSSASSAARAAAHG